MGLFNHSKENCRHPILHYIIEIICLFCLGGAVYICIELGFRGHTHWSMFIVGGLAFLSVGALNNCIFDYRIGMIPQMVMGGIAITVIEFIAGLILNVWLGLGVWDYSDMPFNILGQICLPFTLAWMALSFVAIVVDDYVRYKVFGEPKVHYHWFYCTCDDPI